MDKVLITFKSPNEPTVSDVKQRFSLGDADIDDSFGVIAIDPDEHLFTALVDPGVAARIQGDVSKDVETFSNPVVGAFGPTRS